MKSLGLLASIFLLQTNAKAALTVTISPGATGTIFSVTQTSPNPTFDGTSPGYTAIVGFVTHIWLSPSAWVQETASGVAGTFTSPLGILTKVGGSGSSFLTGLEAQIGVNPAVIIPGLALQTPLLVEGTEFHQFSLAATSPSEIAIDFSHFIPGTYIESGVIFGQITTVVVPEPGSFSLLAFTALTLLARRKR